MNRLIPAAAAAALLVAGAALAQPPAGAPAAPAPQQAALAALPAKAGAKLTVTTPAWQNGADIPFVNTQYRGNVFPGLTWTAGPAGTRSYAIIMQDTDGPGGRIILHWTMWNIPGNVTSLPAGMAADAKPAGSVYGPNYSGPSQPYLGPRTPAGPKHNYHIQVFALDTALPTDPPITALPALIAAMSGHVLASGEVVGLGSVDPDAPPPAARGGRGPGGAPGGGAPGGGAPGGGRGPGG